MEAGVVMYEAAHVLVALGTNNRRTKDHQRCHAKVVFFQDIVSGVAR